MGPFYLNMYTDCLMQYTCSCGLMSVRIMPVASSLMKLSCHCRLVKYDLATNSTEVILDGLHFANGVQLSRNEDYVLVAETSALRIMK